MTMRIEQWITHLERLGAPDPPEIPAERSLLAGDRGEQLLWRACQGESIDLAAALVRRPETAPRESAVRSGDTLVPDGGPLLSPDGYLAIEVWAECELSAVHALHRLIRQRHAALPHGAAARLDRAVRWHLEHTQPDNSTNRPWAIHVFLLAAHGRGAMPFDGGDAALYAETLLHNMSASDARNEPLSRWILADAARELRLAVAARDFGAH